MTAIIDKAKQWWYNSYMHPRVNHVYWRPHPKFIDELCNYLQGKRVLEIFAGNGYLAKIIADHHIDITATSLRSSHDGHQFGMYHEVIEMDCRDAVVEYGDAHDILLLTWPTVTEAAIQAVKLWGDKPFVYVGEVTNLQKCEYGGCATDAFFDNVAFTKYFESYKGNYIEKAAVGRLRYKARYA